MAAKLTCVDIRCVGEEHENKCNLGKDMQPKVRCRYVNKAGSSRPGEWTKGKGTKKPDGSGPQNGHLYCYGGTNITGERVVNYPKTQLNDALIASQGTVPLL